MYRVIRCAVRRDWRPSSVAGLLRSSRACQGGVSSSASRVASTGGPLGAEIHTSRAATLGGDETTRAHGQQRSSGDGSGTAPSGTGGAALWWTGRVLGLAVFPFAVWGIDRLWASAFGETSDGNDNNKPAAADAATADGDGESITIMPAASLGGPFELVDCHTGRAVTDVELFRGKWSLLYFGFAKCAEVCPSTMAFMAQALLDPRLTKAMASGKHAAAERTHDGSGALSPSQGRNEEGEEARSGEATSAVIQVCFVTVDTVRDTPEKLDTFLNKYRRGGGTDEAGTQQRTVAVVGLSGSPAQLAKAAKAWRVYFSTPSETEEERLAREAKGVSLEEALGGDAYQLDHSAAIYFVGPDGKLRDLFFKEMGREAMVGKILLHLSNAYGIDE